MTEPDDDGVLWAELGDFAPSVPPAARTEPRVDLGPGGSLRQQAEQSRRRRQTGQSWGWLRGRGAWSRGEQWLLDRADAEQRCADELDTLEPLGWTVLHDRLLPAGEHRVAHIAIGPAGLVVVTELPDTGALSIVGELSADGTDSRQLYAGDLHLDPFLRTRRWEAAQLEQAVAAAHQDIVWQGPTVALAVEAPPRGAERPATPPELPYEWAGVLIRPARTVPALLAGLPSPLPPGAVADLARLVAEMCSPAGRPADQSNNDG